MGVNGAKKLSVFIHDGYTESVLLLFLKVSQHRFILMMLFGNKTNFISSRTNQGHG